MHSASFPFFSLLGAALALRLTRAKARLIVDWWEIWSPAYWRSYLGTIGGRIGAAIQSFCIRLPDRSFTFSRLVESRLQARRPGAQIERLTGAYSGSEGVRRVAVAAARLSRLSSSRPDGTSRRSAFRRFPPRSPSRASRFPGSGA